MRLVALVSMFAICGPAFGEQGDFLEGHSANVQILRGYQYELGSEDRTIVTAEYANKWRYGDFFVFSDFTFPDRGKFFFYVEPTLRLSLGKATGRDFSFGIVKDVFAAAQFEIPKGGSVRRLGGVSVDLDIPGFNFVKLNAMARDHPDLPGATYQFTTIWKRQFEIGSLGLLAEGFADFAGREDVAVANQLIVPRLLLDIGSVAGGPAGKFWAGVEWQYWRKKFGVPGATESVVQAQIKWAF